VSSWFKRLKKWQKGALIGCGVGLIFASLLMYTEIAGYSYGKWILWKEISEFHGSLFVIFQMILDLRGMIDDYAISAAMIVCYGGFGAIVGRTQQVTDPYKRWFLTGLLALFLLFIYLFNFQVARWAENL